MVDQSWRKIVVLRANGLGDFLQATPALRALGKAYPAAEITFLTLPWLQRFLSGRYPYLRRVEVIPRYPGINEPAPHEPQPAEAVEAFFARMQAEHFDLAIQMHGGGAESNPFIAKLGARHTLALAAAGSLPLEQNLRYCYYQHEVIRYLELVGQLGVVWDGLQTDLPVLAGDRVRLAQVWRPEGRRYAVLHVGAGDVRRRWPAERFARVAEHLYARYGCEVVLTGRAEERPALEQVQAGCRVLLVDLGERLDLGMMAALLSGAALLVSNDTGPAHMAYALDTPAVIVFWCGNVITAGPLKRERFRPVLSWTLTCPICGTAGRCACPASWVAGASLEEVLAEADDLLAN
ncbi:MAG TPA: glycosyltransferase family 9 protein [Anaerolineae bacterium]|nr:glycosyltransferase family 9 protein [Anaerolineae bacterium]HOQ98263.1 glycosyltransferase family 9 protein [Anaerolineae bacterium]HPL28973.1 glycosyltransferase family 9 protein [Anaerolineae bacterium]